MHTKTKIATIIITVGWKKQANEGSKRPHSDGFAHSGTYFQLEFFSETQGRFALLFSDFSLARGDALDSSCSREGCARVLALRLCSGALPSAGRPLERQGEGGCGAGISQTKFEFLYPKCRLAPPWSLRYERWCAQPEGQRHLSTRRDGCTS